MTDRAQIGLMVEGQHGLNWKRWQKILETAEAFGYQCVFRSDHYTDRSGPDSDSLELFTSLTYAASHTQRIELGSLVAPVTFRHPAMTIRQATAIDDLSNGRLILGLGAGWQEREHTKFGIPFYDFKTRFNRFSEALEVTRRLLSSDQAVDFEGAAFSLKDAVLLPRPERRTPILVGGNGPRRTIPLAAEYADEWNGVFINLDTFKARMSQLDDLAAKGGRNPADIKRSIMAPVVWARNQDDLRQKLSKMNPDATLKGVQEMGLIAGTSEEIVVQMNQFVEAGCERFMLQITEYDDLEPLLVWSEEILPHFHTEE